MEENRQTDAHTRAKEYSFREFRLLLRQNGYYYVRSCGDHNIFSNDVKVISIPNHGKQLNRMLCRRLIKEYELVE